MIFMKRAVFIEAVQWFKHGDSPDVIFIPDERKDFKQSRRDKVGWLPTPEGGHAVFSGDWVIRDEKGKLSTCNPITFAKLYESATPNLRDTSRPRPAN